MKASPLPGEVYNQSYCNAQTVQPVAWVEFLRKVGQFDGRVLKDVRTAIGLWLGL
jgi:hypothetical protein